MYIGTPYVEDVQLSKAMDFGNQFTCSGRRERRKMLKKLADSVKAMTHDRCAEDVLDPFPTRMLEDFFDFNT